MERSGRNISPWTWISCALNNRRSVAFPCVRNHAKPIARTPGICDNVEYLAVVAVRCITRRTSELTVRTVSIDRCPRGEGHGLVVLFHNLAAIYISNDAPHVRPFVWCCPSAQHKPPDYSGLLQVPGTWPKPMAATWLAPTVAISADRRLHQQPRHFYG